MLIPHHSIIYFTLVTVLIYIFYCEMDMVVKSRYYQIECYNIESLRYNDISLLLARLDEFVVHRAHSLQILFDNAFHRPCPFRYIPPHPSDQSNIVISVNEDLNVHQIQ